MIEAPVVFDALRKVFDPETGLNVVDLGLIYDVAVHDTGSVRVQMTFTTPFCPAGEAILQGVERAVERVDGVSAVDVDITFEPAWTPERISPEGRTQLGW